MLYYMSCYYSVVTVGGVNAEVAITQIATVGVAIADVAFADLNTAGVAIVTGTM